MNIKANKDSQENKESAGEQASSAGSNSGTTETTTTSSVENSVSAEEHKALLDRLNEQDKRFEQLLEKFDSVQAQVQPVTQPIVVSNTTVQSEIALIKKKYDEQYKNATLLQPDEQVVYYCYLYAYPVLGYIHDKTREFINPPFIKQNGKPDEICFVSNATLKDHDPIDGERPVPYAMYRPKYKEEVEFLDNHPDLGTLFYKHTGKSTKKDDLKAASLRAAIGAQINTMSPNALGQKCMQFGVVFDPHNIRDARKLLLDAMFNHSIENPDDGQAEEVMNMFANASRVEHIGGTPVAVQDLSGMRNAPR